MDIVEFLLARIADDEASARRYRLRPGFTIQIFSNHDGFYGHVYFGNRDLGRFTWEQIRDQYQEEAEPDRQMLAKCEAMRKIIALHESWPVLVEQIPEIDFADGESTTLDRVVYQLSQQIAWMTTQEYRRRFGTDPPASPILRALATAYAGHEDYDEAWR